MTDLINALLVTILVLNLFALGTSRIQSVIRIVAAQGALLGLIMLLSHESPSFPVVLSAAAAVLIKAVVIPAVMMRSLRSAEIKREVEPFIGFLPSIVLGAAATAIALLVFQALAGPIGAGTGARLAATQLAARAPSLLIPASIATVFVGFLILVSRFKAITQVLGYLVLENGIYIFGILLVEAIPLVVEMGMLLDLFVGVFVISIITNHINRAFSSMDTRRLVSLKE
jgi:hydrogenase-4 component E